ncbi:PH domain-containing protein [Pelagicoccus sp. SDUM812003]|uniref:PH domain-containing protein n=1 Tax=Pelagicoccus sp. SDUM812003 TaxID=3041267 RepID=UPI00280F4166|nr:PH domain-containing protein [Pelagicoccus sp. SDUM812003]MDQ8205382.1 PH domain-containing protein [Pelagicoccus sp. SDUM812003]
MNTERISTQEESDWLRLSPVSIIFFIIKFTVLFVKRWLVNVVPALAAVAFFSENKLLLLSIALPVIVFLVTVYSMVYYWHFTFCVRDGNIRIHQGVFAKQYLNLEFARMQNVNIVKPLYFAPFKVVNCVIESAGSKATEVELPGVDEAFALELQSEVFASDTPDVEREPVNAKDGAAPFLKLSNWEIAKSGLTSYFALVIFAAIAPFLGNIGERLSDTIIPKVLGALEPIVGNKIIAGGLLIVAAVSLYIILIITASMVGALIRFYGYELHNQDDKLVRVTGLFEKRSTTLKKSKIQAITISQNVAARLLERIQLQYSQVGARQTKQSDSSILIPILLPKEAERLTSLAFSDCPEPKFEPIHPSYLYRVFLYFWAIPAVCIVSIFSILLSGYFVISLIALVPVFAVLVLRRRRYGFWHNDEYGAIRQGMLGQTVTLFPLHKCQLAKVSQSRGQRVRGLGNLTVQLGSGIVSIPYLPIPVINRFVDQTLYKVESSSKAWM